MCLGLGGSVPDGDLPLTVGEALLELELPLAGDPEKDKQERKDIHMTRISSNSQLLPRDCLSAVSLRPAINYQSTIYEFI